MATNHRYLLELALSRAAPSQPLRVLDFGCGQGEIVEEGRRKGLDIYGADIFYAANPETRATLLAKGLLGDRIREIKEGRIPFADESFDLVVSCMVFEHVQDLEAVLQEIHRVLKPGGVLVSLFPTIEVWREAHTGIPFLHWFRRDSKARRNYAWTMRAIGFGTFKSRPLGKWVDGMLHYLDSFVYYRPQSSIEQMVGRHFVVAFLEPHHVAFRLRAAGLGVLSPVVRLPGLRALCTAAFRRMAYLALVARKSGGDHETACEWSSTAWRRVATGTTSMASSPQGAIRVADVAATGPR